MKSNTTGKLLKQAITDLIRAIEAGQSERLRTYLMAMARFHRYSLANMFLIMAQRPTATYVAGYRTWQKLGRQVRQGEKGIAIMAPVVYRRPKNDADHEELQETLVSFRGCTVFDVSQTDGKALPTLARVAGQPGEYLDQVKQFVVSQGFRLDYETNLMTMEGFCTGDRIVIKDGLELGQEFSVLIHELAHALLHQDKNLPERRVRELEAESVACVVCEALGLTALNSSVDYIQLYQGDRKMLIASLERIQKTAAEIFEGVMNPSEVEVVVEMSQSATVEPVLPMAA